MPSANPNDFLVAKLLGFYGLRSQRILPPQKGYRNTSYPVELTSGKIVNLILYKNEPDVLGKIQDANLASDFLAAKGLAVRHTAHPRIAQLKTSTSTRYAALYNYLPGHTIPWEAYTKAHIKLLGCTMSDMHAALLPAGKLVKHTVTDEYKAILKRMERYFRDPRVAEAMKRKLQIKLEPARLHHYETLLDKCATLPHQQTLHMDLVRSNILFDDTPHVTGILDFEKTAHGHPLFDIARTLAFLLVDCKYTPPHKVRKYFLYSGYQKRGAAHFTNPSVKLRGHTSTLLEELVDLFLLYDFYKFLRHNPYEFLPQNGHFIRTHDLLVKQGLIR